MKNTHERRRDARIALDCPVKVQCETTGRYLSGLTRDVSATGLLLEIHHPSLLVQGQRLRVGIAWQGRSGLLASSQMLTATVVRSLGLGGKQHVALSFEERQSLSLAATA